MIPLPKSIDLTFAGSMLCSDVTAFRLLLTYHTTATSRIGVIGIDGFGYITIRLLWVMGMEVATFSSNPVKE